MGNKKTAVAKTAVKKVAKKVAPKRRPKVVIVRAEVKLLSFAVTAVIPTQQYGNIQPRIEVSAPSIEEARSVVMPIIEDLYKTYAEAPLNGKEPKFYGKIVETTKVVGQVLPIGQTLPTTTETAARVAATPIIPQAPDLASAVADTPSVPVKEKPMPVQKAEKAISLATTLDALEVIEDQIQKSTKIAQENKPEVLTLVLKKRKELKGE